VRGVGIVSKTEPIGRNIIFGGKNSNVHAGRIVLNTLDKIAIVAFTGGPRVPVARDRGSLGKTVKPGRAVPNGCRGAGPGSSGVPALLRRSPGETIWGGRAHP
jgi:hypothetical protein